MTSLLVTDRNQNCVLQYDYTTGAYINTPILQGSGTTALVRPSGIAVDSKNNVYVASITRHAILKYAFPALTPSFFCDVGSGNEPYGLLFDDDGNLYVAIATAARPGGSVQRFTAAGALDTTWAAANGEMSQPRGMEFDSDGNLYVAAFGTHRVVKFDPTGAYVREYAPILNPYDIEILDYDGKEMLWVSATGIGVVGFQAQYPNNPVGGHVQIWSIDGGFFELFGGGGPVPLASGILEGPGGENYLYLASGHGFSINNYDDFGQFQGVFASGGGLGQPDFMVEWIGTGS
jgi:sugar lactone lactonase YvrE